MARARRAAHEAQVVARRCGCVSQAASRVRRRRLSSQEVLAGLNWTVVARDQEERASGGAVAQGLAQVGERLTQVVLGHGLRLVGP